MSLCLVSLARFWQTRCMSRLSMILLMYLCLPGFSLRASDSPFAVVFIDGETERLYGEFPLNRKIIAQGIDCIADVKARGLIIKFFFDVARDADGDAALAKSISRLPTVLEAR